MCNVLNIFIKVKKTFLYIYSNKRNLHTNKMIVHAVANKFDILIKQLYHCKNNVILTTIICNLQVDYCALWSIECMSLLYNMLLCNSIPYQ